MPTKTNVSCSSSQLSRTRPQSKLNTINDPKDIPDTAKCVSGNALFSPINLLSVSYVLKYNACAGPAPIATAFIPRYVESTGEKRNGYPCVKNAK